MVDEGQKFLLGSLARMMMTCWKMLLHLLHHEVMQLPRNKHISMIDYSLKLIKVYLPILLWVSDLLNNMKIYGQFIHNCDKSLSASKDFSKCER
jgi:hypothetical protein